MHLNESMYPRPQLLIRDHQRSGQFLAPVIVSLLLAVFSLQGTAWSQPKESPQSDVVAQESRQGNGKVIEFKQLKLEGHSTSAFTFVEAKIQHVCSSTFVCFALRSQRAYQQTCENKPRITPKLGLMSLAVCNPPSFGPRIISG